LAPSFLSGQVVNIRPQKKKKKKKLLMTNNLFA
jgi:hypothetical protein